jgi:hypothetical protein
LTLVAMEGFHRVLVVRMTLTTMTLGYFRHPGVKTHVKRGQRLRFSLFLMQTAMDLYILMRILIRILIRPYAHISRTGLDVLTASSPHSVLVCSDFINAFLNSSNCRHTFARVKYQ